MQPVQDSLCYIVRTFEPKTKLKSQTGCGMFLKYLICCTGLGLGDFTKYFPKGGLTKVITKSITMVFVEQLLVLPGSAKKT